MVTNRDRVSSFEIGMIMGIAFGLLDALRAIAITEGPSSHSIAAMLVSITAGGAGGLVALPLLLKLLGRSHPSVNVREPRTRIIGKDLLSLVASILGVSVMGFLISRFVAYILPALDPRMQPILGFVLTGILVVVILRLLKLVRIRQPLAVQVILAGLCLPFATGVITLGDSLSHKIDYGEGKISETKSPLKEDLPNILFIVMDTVRADHLPLYGYPKETTPFLSELAKESMVYERAISPAPWTLPSHASMFTGQFPSVHRATTEHRSLRPDFVTLAEMMREKGYATAGFSCNGVVSSTYNLHQGFENFYEIFRLRVDDIDPIRELIVYRVARRLLSLKNWSDKGAVEVNRLLGKWFSKWEKSERKRPFFIFINYLEPHLPYDPPEPYRSKFVKGPVSPTIKRLCSNKWFSELFRLVGVKGSVTPQEYRQLSDLYDGALYYMDAQLRNLFDQLRQRNLLDNTFILIVSDHGENLGEHGGLLDHFISIHQTVLHVPLLIRYPPLFAKGRRFSGLVSTASVFPTILEVADAKPSPNWPPSLGSLPRNPRQAGLEFAISEYSIPVNELGAMATDVHGVDISAHAVRYKTIQNESWKFVHRSDNRSALYDLTKDPGEEKALETDRNPQGIILRKELDSWVHNLAIPTFSSAGYFVPLDKGTKESLRSLGYVR